jgi:hypothetical protein
MPLAPKAQIGAGPSGPTRVSLCFEMLRRLRDGEREDRNGMSEATDSGWAGGPLEARPVLGVSGNSSQLWAAAHQAFRCHALCAQGPRGSSHAQLQVLTYTQSAHCWVSPAVAELLTRPTTVMATRPCITHQASSASQRKGGGG